MIPMSNIARDRKKSNFSAQTVIPSGATFDFVYNGTNYKITVEDMIAAFGTVGTLSQLGDAAETPILKQTGTLNEIRNLEDGSGVKASISADGGAQLDHNFSNGSGGTDVISGITETAPVVKNIIGGTGITITDDDNGITISLT